MHCLFRRFSLFLVAALASFPTCASNAKLGAGIEIENAAPAILPPLSTSVTQQRYAWTISPRIEDMNNDGRPDFIYIGVYDWRNLRGDSKAGPTCTNPKCTGRLPGPTLYLANPNGTWSLRDDLIIDRRNTPGQQLPRETLIADFNNDGVKDIFIADHGDWSRHGFRDSYFLSQPNGTWLESSLTHLQNPSFINFDHAAATGVIDNDGDIDVLMTDLNPGVFRPQCVAWHECFFFCRKNDGHGRMTLEACGGSQTGGMELADIDGDGDLDSIIAGNEIAGRPHNDISPTGIVVNDGTGFFLGSAWPPFPNVVPLPRRPGFFGDSGENSASDLDGDGDLDIVISRNGIAYVGTALQIIENLGGWRFRDRGLIVFERPPASWPLPPDDGLHEDHEWNAFVHGIRFKDFNRDGRMDIYTISNQERHYGVVLMNRGNWRFGRINPFAQRNPLHIVPSWKLN